MDLSKWLKTLVTAAPILIFVFAVEAFGASIWPSTAVPVVADDGPDSAVELGVKFRSDSNGSISGIRFYKASTNTGTHVANLWSSTGTRLATATFANETASGWQQVNFSSPVAITANTVYVASYHTNTGHYSGDLNYFTGKGADNPPLHALADGVSGVNGTYAYGSTSNFPNNGWKSSNYWVDVVFTPGDTAPPTVTAFTVPATATTLAVSISSFTATDNIAVTGYLVNESATAPAASATGWTATAPASYTFATAGTKTLYAWAKDAAGNVSTSRSAAVTVALPDTIAPTVTAFTVPPTATTLTVAITSFTATDNVAVSGYLVNESATAPAASAAGWTTTAPSVYTFTTAGIKTLYAWAKDAAGNVSAGSSAALTVTLSDSIPPTVTAFTVPDTATTLAVSITTFTATDNIGVTGYLVNESATAPSPSAAGWTAAAPISYTFATAGTKTLYAWAKDAVGNVSAGSSAMITVTLPDTAAPTVTVFSVPATATTLAVSITSFTATDNVAVTGYLVNESATAPAASATGWTATAPASYTFATAGTKTLYAWAKDAAGNVSTSRSAAVTVALPDTIAPTVTAFTVPPTATTLTVAITSFTATDNVAVSGYLVNESATAPAASAAGWTATIPVSYTFTTAGSKILYAWVKDAAGNVSTSRSAAITITLPASSSIWPNTTVPGTADSGPDSAVELGVKFRSDSNGSISGIRFYKASTNTGTHVANLWSSTGTRLATATFANETASGWQQVSFSSPVAISANTVYVASYHTNTGHYSGDLNYFTGKGADNPPLHALANGVSGVNGVYAYGSTSSFPSNGWNSSNYWVDVVFAQGDTSPPTVTAFTVPATATTLAVSITSFTASDNVAVTGYLVNEFATAPAASAAGWIAAAPASYTFATAGAKTLYAWAKDAAGNVSTSRSAAITVTLPDTAAPTVTVFSVPATATTLAVSITSFTATDNVGVTGYLVNESATAPAASAAGWTASAPASYTFATAGTKTLYAWAKDAAGNVSASRNATLTVTLPDTIAPTVTAFTVPPTATTLTVAITSFTATDNVAVSGYLVNESATAPAASAAVWTTTAPSVYTFTTAGIKTLYAWAKDAAGNVSAGSSAALTITLPDTVAPTVTVFSVPATSTTLTIAITSLTASDDVAVTGYLVNESATAPAASAAGWTATAPASYTFSSIGSKNLYAWAKDAAGNVSTSMSANAVVLPEPAGWYSGDMHAHRSCGGTPETVQTMYQKMSPQYLSVISLLADMGNGEVQAPATDLPLVNGQDASVSTPGQILHWDTEWHWDPTANQYPHKALGGHIVALGLSQAQQIWEEYTYPVFNWAHQQGGIAGFAHMQYLDNSIPQSLSCCTPIEYPVEVALGASDFISEDVSNSGSTCGGGVQQTLYPENAIAAYYRLLNNGFRPGFAAGTDYPCNCQNDLGTLLTYVQIAGGQMNYRNWINGIASGRTVVSRNGHNEFISLTVNGSATPGDEIRLTGGGNVQVAIQWTANQNLSGTIELVNNGVVVASIQTSATPSAPASLNATVNFTKSGWLAARRMGSDGHQVHTAAVFVLVDNAPIRASVGDAQFYVQWMDNLLEKTSPGGVWNSLFTNNLSDAQSRYQAAKALYQQIALEAGTSSAPSLSSITVTPGSQTISIGSPQQFIATGTYSDGSTLNLTAQVAWTSSNTNAVTINKNGLAMTVTTGSTTISATIGGVTSSTAFTVQAIPLTITAASLPSGYLSIPYSATLPAIGGTPPYTWSITGGSLPAGLSLNSGTGYITGTPTATGTFSFTAHVTDSVGSAPATKSLSITVLDQQASFSVWPGTTVPALLDAGLDTSAELGVKFQSDMSGYITGVRFYKASTNTGPHTGNLWTGTGTLLASAAFTDETVSGWQQVNFPTPVAITANTVYVASYHTSVGHYSVNTNYFSGTGMDSPPLHALADGVSGVNGVFAYGTAGSFPNQGSDASNYWVDVAFSPSAAQDTTPPAVTAFTAPTTSTTLSVAINSFTASDNVAVTGYLVNESATAPAASAVGWTASAPTSYTFATAGAKTLYAWAKDAAGNVSSGSSAALTITLPDTVAPSVTAFSVPATATTLAVSITSFTASDDVAVTGYLVNESATAPAASTAGWTAAAPASYTFATAGAKTLYAWAKDAAGNVSAGSSAAITVTISASKPILIVSSASNPFSAYYSEIIQTEGLNAFNVSDISLVSSAVLAAYDIVVLGEVSLTTSQVTMFTDWVNSGGHLIAMRPDKKLAGLLGLTALSTTVSNSYLMIDTSSGPGAGLVNETIQYHGTADRYALNGASSLATLYSDATTATTSPAVTLRDVGTAGGQAAAFTYDLARSVVYTRQGNPAWSGEARDGNPPVRSDDLYFGAASFDNQPDWVNLNKVAIPQADEQQRLLANLIIRMNLGTTPLPRFWYFPRNLAAVLVMTGDDHGSYYSGGATAERFDQFLAASPAGCVVDNWECVRASSYLIPLIAATNPLTNSQAAAYTNLGFEVSAHIDSNPTCTDWTASSLNADYTSYLSSFASQYPSVPAPKTHRMHCVSWSDYDSQPKVEISHGIRLDTSYYYYPGSWINNVPGLFTGSGMPMRFADINGNTLNIYQATTQMTDESGQLYPYTVDTLLDNALGSAGYYGAFVANMHTDEAQSSGADAIVQSALVRGIPVITASQLLTWLDGRNASNFSALSWNGTTLGFSINLAPGANGLVAMVPIASGLTVTGVTNNGNQVPFSKAMIKGMPYARFPAANGVFQVNYGIDTGSPAVSGISPADQASGVSVISQVVVTLSEAMDPATVNTGTIQLRNTADALVPATVVYNGGNQTATLAPAAPLANSASYTVIIKGGTSGVKDITGTPMVSDFTSSFTTAAASAVSYSIWPDTVVPVVKDSGPDSAVELGVKFKADFDGTITGIRFYKASGNTGTHIGNLWTSTGTRLATATFTNETASGWQQVSFSTPVAATANTVYVASYHTNVGHYSDDQNYFTGKGADNPPLHALSDGTSGFNGVYAYGSSSNFPNQGWNSSNYWVDVIFSISGAGAGALQLQMLQSQLPTLSSIKVAPYGQRVATGTSQQFTATGSFSDGSIKDITNQVSWTSSNTSVATISSTGILTAIHHGSTTITAVLNGISGSTNLTATEGIACLP